MRIDNLALRLRPQSIDQIAGQKHICSPSSPFYKLLKSGTIPHCIFFGPAGVGKTTLARIVSCELELPFYELDATSVKVEAFRKIFAEHRHSLAKPLIFIDEVHRLSKTQQEVLLLPMENKEAVIIGASTENPYFTLSSGIRSRSMLFEFFSLNHNDLEEVINKAQKIVDFTIEDDARGYLISSSSGDSRSLLNLLEFATKVSLHVTLDILKSLRPSALKDGVSSSDSHYNLISAMIKSVRGSDVDAALYYLARLIDGGESADFIARRLVILASEDIGNANPNALNLANSCLQSVSKIGFPESRIILAQVLVYLASSPKSNSCYKGINEALAYVKNEKALKIPSHIEGTHPKGYKYPHDFGGWIEQDYLERNVHFYENSTMGFEKTLEDWLNKIKNQA